MTAAVTQIRVLLVDDDPAVRMGLRFMLGASEDIEVVAEASDGDEVVSAVHAHRPHVVVLDVRMTRQGGIETIGAIKALPDPPRVLMFTVWEQDQVAGRAIEAGADGFLLKTASPEEIRCGIRNVRGGLGAVSPKTAAQLFDRVRGDVTSPLRAEARSLVESLTARERDVVQGIARGLTNAEIARELYVGETTVKSYVTAAFGKLGVDNRATAAILADRAGLLTSSP